MDWHLLKKLTDTPGLPGSEDKIRDILNVEFSALTNEIHVDGMGNIIAHIRGDGPKLMLDAHMDEVGFMVRHIDNQGFLHVISLGGIDPRVFYSQRVVIWGREQIIGVVGAAPPHLSRGKPGNDEAVPIEDCFIDTGLSAEKVRELVKLGDLVTFNAQCFENEESLIGKAFDDRVGLFIMLECAKSAEELGCDLYLVGAVQEESGLRGAASAAYAVEPDLALSLEGTLANDIPGAPAHKQYAIQGKGPEIRLCDRSFIADRKWTLFIADIAEKKGIPYQIMVKKIGGTNAARIQTSKTGVRNTALSVPVRYLHSAQGIIKKVDIENSVRLVAAIIEQAKDFS